MRVDSKHDKALNVLQQSDATIRTKTVCSPDQARSNARISQAAWPPRQGLGWWPGAIATARLLDHKRLATTHPTSQRQLTAALDSPRFTLALHQGRLSGGA